MGGVFFKKESGVYGPGRRVLTSAVVESQGGRLLLA